MRRLIYFIIAVSFLVVSGCASVDPLEPVNRKIFAFNMILDRAVMRPVATAYDKVMPPYLVCRISNFFDNIDDVTNIANNALQFKLLDAWSDTWRVAFNTTFGLVGLFDVATCAGLPKHHQDFGLTLARYGLVKSSYLVIPFFGPSTLRDTIGWSIDWRYLSVWPFIKPDSLRYGIYGLRIVHKRASYLAADKLIDEALDPYLFVRDAYLQKRDSEIEALHPTCDPTTTKTSTKKSDDDTFVSDGDSENKKDADDTFVEETTSQSTKTTTKKAAVGNDPFEEP